MSLRKGRVIEFVAYHLSSQDDALPFVANVIVKEGSFSEHGQLIISETPGYNFLLNSCVLKNKLIDKKALKVKVERFLFPRKIK